MNTAIPGATVPLVLRVVDDNTPENNPVTGLSAVVAIRRAADDKWYNFVAGEWDVVAGWENLEPEHKQALADKGDGSYAYAWDQAAADNSAEGVYEMTYAVTAGDPYAGRQAGEVWRFTRETPRAVWEQAPAGRLLGLLGENQYLDEVVADEEGRMTAGRLRLYAEAQSVGTDENVIATYAIEATYEGSETYAATYKMVLI